MIKEGSSGAKPGGSNHGDEHGSLPLFVSKATIKACGT